VKEEMHRKKKLCIGEEDENTDNIKIRVNR
jgi:hypothetical protein